MDGWVDRLIGRHVDAQTDSNTYIYIYIHTNTGTTMTQQTQLNVGGNGSLAKSWCSILCNPDDEHVYPKAHKTGKKSRYREGGCNIYIYIYIYTHVLIFSPLLCLYNLPKP